MKKIFIMSIITMLSSLFSCQAQNKGYKSLSTDDYEKAIADTTVIRLDVRTAEEFADGHIRGAINIDVLKSDFEQKTTATLPKKDYRRELPKRQAKQECRSDIDKERISGNRTRFRL